ncbi:MAG TPA: dihydrofolate reductase family protein [Kribbella sp.]
MRKLIESTFVTLNGVIENPQDWCAPYWDDEYLGYNQSLMEGVEGQVLGRVTYEGFADAWLSRAGDPFADVFNAMPKWVASRTVTEWRWNARPLEGDAADAVRRLKESEGGNLIKYGTGSFSKTLLENKLVDEYHFWMIPALADGENMLHGSGIDPTHLELLGTTTFKSGIVVHKLAPKA